MNLIKNSRFKYKSRTFEVLGVWFKSAEKFEYEICELCTKNNLTYKDKFRTVKCSDIDGLKINTI